MRIDIRSSHCSEDDARGHEGRAAKEAGAYSNGMGGYLVACCAVCALLYVVQYILCHAYVNKMPHFKLTSSSLVEGAHSLLKRRLQVSIGDMMYVVERVLQFLSNQYQEIDIVIS